MARKAKSRGGKARQAKQAGKAKVVPTYMTGTKPLKIGLHDVISVIELVTKRKHVNKLKRIAKKQEMVVLVEPPTVNRVKDFMVKHKMHDHRVGKIVINPQPGPSVAESVRTMAPRRVAAAPPKKKFECDFSKH
ncbi:hypothetical protein J6500_17760 [Bradyrhizobium sp. WSM 1704]|uniref:hypothetical protein n=1 Tax=Bradyrhizobium semiaridum TaxID=2821404 RepID=UPI001CE34D11|nr:hypothetical protein [Bradyrhizobium semiaridum]MCA6123730.1 hypothetical protein [Bradyrhizobium semiaridum]